MLSNRNCTKGCDGKQYCITTKIKNVDAVRWNLSRIIFTIRDLGHDSYNKKASGTFAATASI